MAGEQTGYTKARFTTGALSTERKERRKEHERKSKGSEKKKVLQGRLNGADGYLRPVVVQRQVEVAHEVGKAQNARRFAEQENEHGDEKDGNPEPDKHGIVFQVPLLSVRSQRLRRPSACCSGGSSVP